MRSAAAIWWDTRIQAYRMRAPFEAKLIDFLKSTIPSSQRSWEPKVKEWIFVELYYVPMRFMAERMWPGSTFVSKEETEAAERAAGAQARSAISGASKTELWQKFAELTGCVGVSDASKIGLDKAKAKVAYLRAMIKFHPDRGGDPAKATELNVVWKELEKLL